MPWSPKAKSPFTLIELLVVIAIIAILCQPQQFPDRALRAGRGYAGVRSGTPVLQRGSNYLFLDGHAAAHTFAETVGDESIMENRHFVREWGDDSYFSGHEH